MLRHALGLWRALIYCSSLWLPLPLPPLFSSDLANKTCPFALHACNKGKATRACFVSQGGGATICYNKLQLNSQFQMHGVLFKLFEQQKGVWKITTPQKHINSFFFFFFFFFFFKTSYLNLLFIIPLSHHGCILVSEGLGYFFVVIILSSVDSCRARQGGIVSFRQGVLWAGGRRWYRL